MGYTIRPNPYGQPLNADEEFKYIRSLFPTAEWVPSLVKIEVVPGKINTFLISWNSVPSAVSYKIHVGFCPILSQAVDHIEITTTSVEYTRAAVLPNDAFPYVWVEWVDSNGSSSLINQDPASLDTAYNTFDVNYSPLEQGYANLTIDNNYIRFILQEIRRREVTMLQNDGEPFILYTHRWEGKKCKCIQDYSKTSLDGDDYYGFNTEDPDKGVKITPVDTNANPTYEGYSQCNLCFGTGIAGGYYHGIPLIARYGNLPTRVRLFGAVGIEFQTSFNTWTLWSPRWHEHDVLYRPATGEYFEVTDPKYGTWRAVPLHQEATSKAIPRKDVRYLLTDSNIDIGVSANG